MSMYAVMRFANLATFALAAASMFFGGVANALELVAELDLDLRDEQRAYLLPASNEDQVVVVVGNKVSTVDWRTGETLTTSNVNGTPYPTQVSEDGSIIAARDGGNSRNYSLWAARTGSLVTEFEKKHALLGRFSPNGKSFLVDLYAYEPGLGAVGIYDVEDREVRRFSTLASRSLDASFSPDGSFIYTIGFSTNFSRRGVLIEKYDAQTGLRLADTLVESTTRELQASPVLQVRSFAPGLVIFQTHESIFEAWDENLKNRLNFINVEEILPPPRSSFGAQRHFFGRDGATMLSLLPSEKIGAREYDRYAFSTLSPNELLETQTFSGGLFSPVFSRTGAYLLGLEENRLRVWKTQPSFFDEGQQEALGSAELSLLYQSLENGDIASLSSAITPGIVLSMPGRPLIHAAAKTGNADVVLLLVENGADINWKSPETNWSPLMTAVASSNEETADLLVKLGADVSVVGADGETFGSLLLKSAIASTGGSDIARLKAELALVVSSSNLSDRLVDAAGKADFLTVATLLSLGVDVDAPNSNDVTPLIAATLSNREESKQIVDHLLKVGGADPNWRARSGSNALQLAIAASVRTEILERLIAATNLELREDGPSVWEIARSTGNDTALALLPDEPWKPLQIPLPSFPNIEVKVVRNMSTDRIMDAQRALASRGLYSSSIDGLWGPASRRGLASYFLVVFDEYRRLARSFCSSALYGSIRHLNNSSSSYEAVVKGNYQWILSKSDNSFGIAVRSEGRDYEVSCRFDRSENVGPKLNSVTVKNNDYIVAMSFIDHCASDDGWARTRLLLSAGGDVAADFSCNKRIQGVPVKANGTFTHWREY